MSTAFQRGSARVHANLTPLIDVTFLLIVFFILVAQISKTQIIEEIDLPEPEDAVSVEPQEERRFILNVIPTPDKTGILEYRLGSDAFEHTPDGLRRLTLELNAIHEDDPNVTLDLRADRRTSYIYVYPALEAATTAGISHVNLVVEASIPGGERGVTN